MQKVKVKAALLLSKSCGCVTHELVDKFALLIHFVTYWSRPVNQLYDLQLCIGLFIFFLSLTSNFVPWTKSLYRQGHDG
jgi:hypothetical protein